LLTLRHHPLLSNSHSPHTIQRSRWLRF